MKTSVMGNLAMLGIEIALSTFEGAVSKMGTSHVILVILAHSKADGLMSGASNCKNIINSMEFSVELSNIKLYQ